MRRNVEYYPRRLRRTHNIDFQLATTPDAVDRGMDHLVRLHQARWTARGETGAFAHPSLEGFLRQTAHHALRHGGTRLWTLALDGTVQAALLGFLDAGVLHYFQQGFNPQFAAYGLGNVMLALCVRACCSDPEVRAFDFMGGGAPYKHLWARKSRNTVCLEVLRPNSRAALYDAHHRLHGAAVDLWRAVTPMPVRHVRSQYLKRRAFKH